MKCPIDQTQLVISDRQGIEIDYCPDCRGVWLDRGELDKLIERADSYAAPRSAEAPVHRDERRDDRQHDRHESHPNRYPDHGYDKKPHKKKRESFLGDLFEFGD